MEIAVLALGCFWGPEKKYGQLEGVYRTEVGYCGGNSPNTNYREVCTGTTNHAEAVKLEFDPKVISYEEIIKRFFEFHDPTTLNSQGPDFGTQYRSAIFYSDEKKFEIATKKINELQDDYVGKIVTLLEKETTFYIAEEYHHKYFSKNPFNAYCFSVIKPKVDKFKSSQK